ncbi:hypothetical protein FGO68_gene742 [Halteria grandinella]|uniref:Uncharacterized protein n=1 Tax=Halteria grandinella TaxID=5974 RepID=A0A8J8NFQ1_HALGN|nr:hypothetical protein FGO68_gene742 [Halteria grandinella]
MTMSNRLYQVNSTAFGQCRDNYCLQCQNPAFTCFSLLQNMGSLELDRNEPDQFPFMYDAANHPTRTHIPQRQLQILRFQVAMIIEKVIACISHADALLAQVLHSDYTVRRAHSGQIEGQF